MLEAKLLTWVVMLLSFIVLLKGLELMQNHTKSGGTISFCNVCRCIILFHVSCWF